ncbi:MAG TPA: DUF2294 domain-containing protein [Solirubrobacteraceae bacterium]|jgi:uncharacterized protein YbcI
MEARSATEGQTAAAVSEALVRIHREYLGRGPTKTRATLRDDTLQVLLYDALTKAERTLADTGRREEVLAMRKTFQQAMRADSVAAVEEITGRTVVAFMSDNHLDPDISVEVFVFGDAD